MTGVKFLGVFPGGVSIILAFTFCVVRALVLLCELSSYDGYQIAGVHFSEIFQTAVATLALVGPPMGIVAGFGHMFRMPQHVRSFSRYLFFVTLAEIGTALYLLIGGGVCAAVAHEVLVHRGPVFVCLFVNIGTTFWGAVLLGLEGAIAFTVHQQADACEKGEQADMLRYASAVPHH
mmetsp:Transcript_44178/g.124764  ORF Transcript_44178/g.124764 Transcript_44178/m.124764 type:complete len:177 (-) Transcript_44178:3-533(-)